MRVFISYSRSDNLFIEQLVPLLDQVFPDYDTWFDQHITGGDDWWRRILSEIDRCDIFIYLMSNDALTSAYCQAEFREALRLQKVYLPVIVRPKTDVSLAPDDLEPEIRRRNWIDMSGGFKDAKANGALFRALRLQVKDVPAQPPTPLHPDPISQPIVSHAKNTAGKKPDSSIIVAIIGAIAVIIAALIGIAPPLLNQSRATPTNTDIATTAPQIAAALTQTFTAQTAVAARSTPTSLPTATNTPIPTATPVPQKTDTPYNINDLMAQTKASWDTATAIAIASFTKTFTPTFTPSATFTNTPNVEKTIEAAFTATAQQAIVNAIASYTKTPTATHTYTPTSTPLPPTATPYPTVSTNEAWTPIPKTFDDGVPMVLVPAGCFNMGSTDAQAQAAIDQYIKDGGTKSNAQTWVSWEQPTNKVCIDQPFWIDKMDVTQAQFKRLSGVAKNNPRFTGDNRPVEQITWFEARDFCVKRGARLPTEAEWEYAARGPDDWVYPWGNDFNAANAANAVYSGNSNNQTADVGSKPSGNSWVGASDMAGNVWQWTSTIFDQTKFPYPYNANDGRNSTSDSNNQRVLRGGSFLLVSFLRSAGRFFNAPTGYDVDFGFRCARS